VLDGGVVGDVAVDGSGESEGWFERHHMDADLF
jgi:hypothetical protein